jgi:branched-chain amino acid transport system permease protein
LFLHLIISGLSNGSIYSITAMGLVLIYKASTVLNFSHGEAFMLGGFLGYTIHVIFKVPFWGSLIFIVVLGFLMGVMTERLAYRPLIHSSIISLVLATVGFSFVIKGVARGLWGGKGEYIPFPPVFGSEPVTLGGIIFFPQHGIIILGTLLFMAIFGIFFKFTKLGKMMRATAENRKAASIVGIRIERIFSIIWGIGTLAGAIAGFLSAPMTLLYPDIGSSLLMKSFAAAVLGGIDSITGAILGGICMGITENLVGGYISTSFVDLSPFIIIIIILIIRPRGFLGSKIIRKI